MTLDPGRAGHEAVQAAHWDRADAAHYEWQTADPVLAPGERELLSLARPRGRFLEVGCGEGGNLFHLRGDGGARAVRFALDRYPAKVAFARDQEPGLRAVAADALALPFADGCFDVVLVRDLLHHVYAREQALREAWRLVAPGGELVLIEPNARNPLILAQGTLVRAERGALRSTPRRLRRELEALPGRGEIEVSMAQPLPIERVVCHPGLGFPALGRSGAARAALRLLDRLHRVVIPRRAWAYFRARVVRSAPASS